MGEEMSKPWREISQLSDVMSWDEQTEKDLRDICLKGPESGQSYGKPVKILMVGATQNGKSSLVNSLLCAMTGKINQYALASKAEHSLTRQLHSPGVQVKGEPLNFRLTDMPGIFQGMKEQAEWIVEQVLKGQIKENVVLPGNLDANVSMDFTQKASDPPCCVVLVMKAGKPLSGDVKEIFNIVIRKAEEMGVKVALVLTHADNLQDEEGPNLKGRNVVRIFREETVHVAVQQASNETGLPISFIHPVVNYAHQVETTTELNILHLYTLSKILDLAWEGARSIRERR